MESRKLLLVLLAYLGKFPFDSNNPLGAVRAERWKLGVDVGSHLEQRLNHLAHSSRTRLRRQNLRPLLQSLHLTSHHNKHRTFTEPVDALVVGVRIQAQSLVLLRIG